MKDRDADEALIKAAESLDFTGVKVALKDGADVNAQDDTGGFPLLFPSVKGDAKLVKLLINSGADVDMKNSYGRTPLMWAALKGHADVVELLIQAGADVDVGDLRWATALLYAASTGETECLELLIDAGADVNHFDHGGWRAITYAVKRGYDDCVELLLNAGAKTKDKANDLDFTVAYRQPSVTASRNQKLMDAAEWGDVYEAKVALKAGADPNYADEKGRTGLHITWEPNIAKLLIKYGADVNAKDARGRTPLEIQDDDDSQHSVANVLKAAGAK